MRYGRVREGHCASSGLFLSSQGDAGEQRLPSSVAVFLSWTEGSRKIQLLIESLRPSRGNFDTGKIDVCGERYTYSEKCLTSVGVRDAEEGPG